MPGTGIGVLDFGTGGDDASLVVTGQAGILSTSLVEAWITPVNNATTNNRDTDEQRLEPIRVHCTDIVAATGFTVRGVCDHGTAVQRIGISWVWT